MLFKTKQKKRPVLNYFLIVFYVAIVLIVFYYSPFFQYVLLKQQVDELLLVQDPSDEEFKQLYQLLRNDDLMMEDKLLIIDWFLELPVDGELSTVPDALIYVIESGEFDDEVRKKALAAAARPIIVTREAYRTDRRIYVKFKTRSGRLNNHRIETGIHYPSGGSTGSGRNQHFGGGSSTTSWRMGGKHSPPYNPGTYEETVTQKIEIYEGAALTRVNPDDEDPLFTIEQEISFNIQVKPPKEADRVLAVTSPELDEKVQAAYTDDPQSGAKFVHRSRYDGLDINSKDLPFSVAFEFVFVDQDGREHPTTSSINNFVDPSRGPTNHGWSTGFNIPSITQPGTYEGTLIFRASDEVAFSNPEIIEYWGGSFGVPFTFDIAEEEK